MIKNYHKHTLQSADQPTTRREEEPPHTNSHNSPGSKLRQRNHFNLPRQDGCKTKMDIKQCKPKERPNTEPGLGTVVPAKSDSDELLCLQLISKATY